MDDLTTWLRAQLDEEEQMALGCLAGSGPVWEPSDEGYEEFPATVLAAQDAGQAGKPTFGRNWSRIIVTESRVAPHIAYWDPARVLAEVDAKRRVLDQCEGLSRSTVNTGDDTTQYSATRVYEVVTLLAAPYANRPGFRDEWQPDVLFGDVSV